MIHLEPIIEAVRAHRPGWSVQGIVKATHELIAAYPDADAALIQSTAVRAAANPEYRAPNAIAWCAPTIAPAELNLDTRECGHGTLVRRCAVCRVDDPGIGGAALRKRLRTQTAVLAGTGNPPATVVDADPEPLNQLLPPTG